VSRPNIGHSHASEADLGAGRADFALPLLLLHAAPSTTAAAVHASATRRISNAVPRFPPGIVHTGAIARVS
jgi:hypothetical protein